MLIPESRSTKPIITSCFCHNSRCLPYVRLSGFLRVHLYRAALFQLRIRVNLLSLPLPAPLLPFPSPLLTSPSFPFLFLSHREAAPLKPARRSGERCKLPRRGPGRSPGRSPILLHCMLAKRIWLQHFCLFGQHCNESQFLGSKMAPT